MINNVVCSTETVNKIPPMYLSSVKDSGRQQPPPQAQAKADDHETEMMEEEPQVDSNNFKILPGENMRISKKGLLFSGPSAFPSNLSKHPICYKKESYILNEQAYQWTKATTHYQTEIDSDIKESTEPWDIMYAGTGIKTTVEWKERAPDILAELVIHKYDQNPILLKRLISTYPMRLIEASVGKKWGGSTYNVRYLRL